MVTFTVIAYVMVVTGPTKNAIAAPIQPTQTNSEVTKVRWFAGTQILEMIVGAAYSTGAENVSSIVLRLKTLQNRKKAHFISTLASTFASDSFTKIPQGSVTAYRDFLRLFLVLLTSRNALIASVVYFLTSQLTDKRFASLRKAVRKSNFAVLYLVLTWQQLYHCS